MRSPRLASTLALALLVGCGGSAPRAYPRAFAEAERAETAGRFAEASAGYDRAAKDAPNAREKAHAEYAAATTLARAGDIAGATTRLERIAYATPPTEHSGRALYDLARLRVAHGDEERGYADFERLVFTFSNDGLARPALRHVLAHKDGTLGAKATSAWLEDAEKKLAGSELEETCAYQLASRAQAAGDDEAAHASYLRIADKWPYPRGRTWDDSLYRAAEIDVKRGKPAEAIEHLERMLDEREESSLMGTYQRPRFTPALLFVAAIYRDKLNDHDRARAAFHRLYADFTTSPFRDDALWEEAKLFRQDGDTSSACSRAASLVSDFPDSRYVPCAVEDCPSVKRPAKSRAPKTCPAYVRKGAAPADGMPPTNPADEPVPAATP